MFDLQPLQFGSARIKSADPVSSTTENPVAGVPTSISPYHSLTAREGKGKIEGLARSFAKKASRSSHDGRPLQGGCRLSTTKDDAHESWYEVISTVPARFSFWGEAEDVEAPYFARMFAACFLNDSTSRLFFPPLRRLIGTLRGVFAFEVEGSLDRGVGEAAVPGNCESDKSASVDASDNVDSVGVCILTGRIAEV